MPRLLQEQENVQLRSINDGLVTVLFNRLAEASTKAYFSPRCQLCPTRMPFLAEFVVSLYLRYLLSSYPSHVNESLPTI